MIPAVNFAALERLALTGPARNWRDQRRPQRPLKPNSAQDGKHKSKPRTGASIIPSATPRPALRSTPPRLAASARSIRLGSQGVAQG